MTSHNAFRYKGTVEAQFLYATLLGDDMLPFGYRQVRLVLLPIVPTANGYELLNAETARAQGYTRLAEWLERAENEWKRLREQKAEKMDIYQRLDYSRGITAQSPTARYRVVYPNFQRVSFASVVDVEQVKQEAQQRYGVPVSGFIVESALYACETNDAEEAHYLCALLNASVIDERLGALRRKEQKTHPNVHKKIFDVAVLPLYEAGDARHRALAALGRVCALRVREALASGALDGRLEIGVLRRRVRELLASELAEVDRLARGVVG
ncbi:MAG: hypothetical protein N2554_09255 [Fimbriimonadales bacterium]|nr:hypothetical protein [Fimbriimonadales bacterium]